MAAGSPPLSPWLRRRQGRRVRLRFCRGARIGDGARAGKAGTGRISLSCRLKASSEKPCPAMIPDCSPPTNSPALRHPPRMTRVTIPQRPRKSRTGRTSPTSASGPRLGTASGSAMNPCRLFEGEYRLQTRPIAPQEIPRSQSPRRSSSRQPDQRSPCARASSPIRRGKRRRRSGHRRIAAPGRRRLSRILDGWLL